MRWLDGSLAEVQEQAKQAKLDIVIQIYVTRSHVIDNPDTDNHPYEHEKGSERRIFKKYVRSGRPDISAIVIDTFSNSEKKGLLLGE